MANKAVLGLPDPDMLYQRSMALAEKIRGAGGSSKTPVGSIFLTSGEYPPYICFVEDK